jgi:transposase-like protein
MTKRRYPRELKEEAVRRVVEGRESVAHVCLDLKIKRGSVYFAIRKFKLMIERHPCGVHYVPRAVQS